MAPTTRAQAKAAQAAGASTTPIDDDAPGPANIKVTKKKPSAPPPAEENDKAQKKKAAVAPPVEDSVKVQKKKAVVSAPVEDNVKVQKKKAVAPPPVEDNAKTKAPGFGLPLNYYPKGEGLDKPFPSALSPSDMSSGRTTLSLTPLREFQMLRLMNQITDKPDWHTKVFDATITKKWTQEASNQVSARMMAWVLAELKYKAKVFEETGLISVYTGDVVKSDTALPESFRLELLEAVKPLEDVPEKDKDWHPGSNNKVLDLVHPSLFPLVYGRSKVLEKGRATLDNFISKCGEGVVVPVPAESETTAGSESYGYQTKNPYSRKFQWLPCEVDISREQAKITSYINNLHPEKHRNLYNLVERAIDAAIPLWNTSLAPTIDCHWYGKSRITYGGPGYSRKIVQPEPGTFVPPANPPHLDLHRTFGSQGLQVIVKLANIELNSKKPSYSGGTWHVEGQLNEHICATALYYYSNENIKDSTLAFRQQSNAEEAMDMEYPQDFHDWLPEVYGCSTDDPGVQDVGGVVTSEGRLLTFPNILQHQVQPFALKDNKKPGHRKILALFLVDPHIRVLSTANVPPQQKEWWIEHLDKVKTGLDKLPQELKDEVFSEIEGGFPISLKEAKGLRAELMKERKEFEIKHDSAFTSLEFSLCEH